MKELKKSQFADGVGYLYRAALYMGQGQRKLANSFLKTAEEKIAEKITIPQSNDDRYVAEKILDEYRKFSLRLQRLDRVRTNYDLVS